MTTTMFTSVPSVPPRPHWVFLDTAARIGITPGRIGPTNVETTADDATKDGEAIQIQVTFSFAQPPCISYLYVHCPNLDGNPFRTAPALVSSAAHLALLRVDIGGQVPEYLLYKAGVHGRQPELELLPEIVSSHIHDKETVSPECVSVSPRGDGSFVLAALKRRTAWCFELHVFVPERRAWTRHSLAVHGYDGLLTHVPAHYRPSKAIVFGNGVLGWADLFHGVLLSNANEEPPDGSPACVHFLPFPKLLPENQRLYTTGTGAAAAGRRLRDVAYEDASALLWLVELEHLWTRGDRVDVSGRDAVHDSESWEANPVAETDDPEPEPAGWRLVTWYRGCDWDCWRKGGVVYSHELLGAISATFRSVVSGSDEPEEERLFVPFGCLEVSNPALGGSGVGEVVYVQATVKGRRNRWLVAVDMRRREVTDVALVSDRDSPFRAPPTYLPCALSTFV